MKNAGRITILLLKINMLLLLSSCKGEIINSAENYEGYIGAIPTSVLPHSDVTSFGQGWCNNSRINEKVTCYFFCFVNTFFPKE